MSVIDSKNVPAPQSTALSPRPPVAYAMSERRTTTTTSLTYLGTHQVPAAAIAGLTAFRAASLFSRREIGS